MAKPVWPVEPQVVIQLVEEVKEFLGLSESVNIMDISPHLHPIIINN